MVVEDGEEPKTKPEAKKSKTGAKNRQQERAQFCMKTPRIRKPHPVANQPHSRSARGMWMGFEPGLRRKV